MGDVGDVGGVSMSNEAVVKPRLQEEMWTVHCYLEYTDWK